MAFALLSTVAVLPLAHAVAFGGPAPTAVEPDRAINGFSPKTTQAPSVAELRRRAYNLYPETCGWVSGDLYSGVTCSYGRTCMLYTSGNVGMAGCCTGSNYQDCGWAASCVDYNAYTSGKCDSDCLLNTFNRVCTNPLSPYCVTWTYPGDGVADYGCAETRAGIETILFKASDSYGTTSSISIPTISGDAVDTSAGESGGTTRTATGGKSNPTSSTSTTGSKTKKKGVSVGLIAGAIVGALVLLFIIVAAVIFICVKKKKSKQLAANQQAVAAAQASRPQSQYPPPQPPMQQQQPAAPMPPPTPQQPYNTGYFPPQGPPHDQKFNPQTQPYDYSMQSPISNPGTPAPAYAQPYYTAPGQVPPMPTQSPAPYPTREPTPGAVEADATPAPHAPAPPAPVAQAQQGPVYEMGSGR